MTFTVLVDPEGKADLLRLYEYLLERAEYVEDLWIGLTVRFRPSTRRWSRWP